MENIQEPSSVPLTQIELRTILFSIGKLLKDGNLSLGDLPILASIRDKIAPHVKELPPEQEIKTEIIEPKAD